MASDNDTIINRLLQAIADSRRRPLVQNKGGMEMERAWRARWRIPNAGCRLGRTDHPAKLFQSDDRAAIAEPRQIGKDGEDDGLSA